MTTSLWAVVDDGLLSSLSARYSLVGLNMRKEGVERVNQKYSLQRKNTNSLVPGTQVVKDVEMYASHCLMAHVRVKTRLQQWAMTITHH